MAVLARMRFRSMSSPREKGALVLNDDGTFQIVPSDEFRAEMARLETVALKRSQNLGYGFGIGFIALGATAILLGWAAGRIFGKLAHSLSKPRSLNEVELHRTQGGQVSLKLLGLENKIQTIQMAWNADEVLETEANGFIELVNEMKRSPTASVPIETKTMSQP